MTFSYIYGLFTIVLIKQIFEKHKSARAASGNWTQFKLEINPDISHCFAWNLHKLINILLVIFYQEKKTTYIFPHPNPCLLPTPCQLKRLLTLINDFLIIAHFHKGSNRPGCYLITEGGGSRWPGFFVTSLSRLKKLR